MKLRTADFAALDDTQRLALLESFFVAISADNVITAAEARRFDEVVLDLPWGVERDVLHAMIKGAQQRIAAVRTPVEVQDYVTKLAQRLPGQDLRERVLYTMATLMWSDGDVSRLEKNVLGLFTMAFGLTSDRVAAIKAALTHTAPPAPPTPKGD